MRCVYTDTFRASSEVLDLMLQGPWTRPVVVHRWYCRAVPGRSLHLLPRQLWSHHLRLLAQAQHDRHRCGDWRKTVKNRTMKRVRSDKNKPDVNNGALWLRRSADSREAMWKGEMLGLIVRRKLFICGSARGESVWRKPGELSEGNSRVGVCCLCL